MKTINKQCLSNVQGGLDVEFSQYHDAVSGVLKLSPEDSIKFTIDGYEFLSQGSKSYINGQLYSTLVPGVFDFSQNGIEMKQSIDNDGNFVFQFFIADIAEIAGILNTL